MLHSKKYQSHSQLNFVIAEQYRQLDYVLHIFYLCSYERNNECTYKSIC